MCINGTEKIVRLNRPREVSGRIKVPVDACIADEVQKMNDMGIVTHGSCCGHGRSYPHVLIDEISVQLARKLGYNTTPYLYGPDEYRGVHEIRLKVGERRHAPQHNGLVLRTTDAVSTVVVT